MKYQVCKNSRNKQQHVKWLYLFLSESQYLLLICKYITEEQSLLLVDHSLSKNCHGNPEAIQKHQSLDVYMVEGCLLCAMHTT